MEQAMYNDDNCERLAEERVRRMNDKERESLLVDMYADEYSSDETLFHDHWLSYMRENE